MLSHVEFNAVRTSVGCGRPFPVRPQRSKMPLASHPAVPVLPVTLAQLDLLLGKSTLDLEEISQLILTDIGATLQVFQSTYNSGASGTWRIHRISDCIVHLGKARMQRQLQTSLSAVIARHEYSVRDLWDRSRATAELSQFLAQQVSGVSPDRAYLAGLFHEVARMPAALGWSSNRIELCDPFRLGCAMIKEWRLPAFLTSSLMTAPEELRSTSPLAGIASAAWSIVNNRCHRRVAPFLLQ
jgi:hypothetical protein